MTTFDDVPIEFYMSYSQTPYNSNGDEAFNISYELLVTVGLKKLQQLLITVINQVYPLERIYVTPVTNEDWDLLVIKQKKKNTIIF